ncbi:MAG: acyltransferase [Desulfobacteraceae bacterium]|nr:acyltransferase [Desulfobacteraceae bacterium]
MQNILRKIKFKLFDLFLDFIYWVGKIEAINKLLYFYKDFCAVYILRKFGAEVGQDVGILPPLIIHTHKVESDYKNIIIGNHCRLGRGTLLDLGGDIVIEERVVISMGVTLLTHIDVGKSPLAAQSKFVNYSKLHIRKGAYIGANATLLGGVTIGENSVVGAGAVILKDVTPFSIVAGVPAKFIGKTYVKSFC